MTSRRQQRDNKPDPFDAARLESELAAARKPNRQERRATQRTAQDAEATGFARVTGKHLRSRPTA